MLHPGARTPSGMGVSSCQRSLGAPALGVCPDGCSVVLRGCSPPFLPSPGVVRTAVSPLASRSAWGERGRGLCPANDRETEAGAGYSLPRRLERCRTPSQALGSAESLSHLTIASRCRAGHPMSGREGVRVARAKEMGETWPDSHSPPPAAPPPRSSLTPRQASAGATIPVRPHPVPVHTMLPLLLLCGALGCGADQAGKARRRWRWGWRGLGLARGGHARLMGR